MTDKLKTIERVVLEEFARYDVKVDRIIVFGDDELDVLIVADREVDGNLKNRIWVNINRRLIEKGIIVDFVIVSRLVFEKFGKKEVSNHARC